MIRGIAATHIFRRSSLGFTPLQERAHGMQRQASLHCRRELMACNHMRETSLHCRRELMACNDRLHSTAGESSWHATTGFTPLQERAHGMQRQASLHCRRELMACNDRLHSTAGESSWHAMTGFTPLQERAHGMQ